MANRVRGIRQRLPANVLLGRLNGAGGPAQALSLQDVANQIIQNGSIPLPGGGGFITAVDSNFTVTGGTLSLHTIAAGDLIGNSTGSTAEPTATTLTALIDRALGNTKGDILYRDTSAWQVLAPGSNTQVLTLASGIPSWAATSGGGSLNNRGAWSNASAYSPFDVVTYNGSAYLNYVAVSAPGATPQQWSHNVGLTVTTTNTTNDTASSIVGVTAGNSRVWGSLGKSSGKWYFEFTGTFIDNGTQMDISDSSGPFAGNVVAATVGGNIIATSSGGGSGSFPGLSNTHRGAIAFDIGGALFWVTPDVTASPINWNGSTSNDPATGVGGVAVGAMSTPWFCAFYEQSSGGQQSILYTDPGTFSIPVVPSGFLAMSTPAGFNTSPDMDDAHWLSQGAIVVGTTEVASGTTGRLLYDNAGVVGEAIVGSGLSLSAGTLTATGSSGLTVGTTAIASGANTKVLFDNSGVLGEYTITGSGNVVMSTSPTLVTPALGTPSALILTNATGLPAAQVLSGALVNGMTATTQTAGDNSTKLATTAYVATAVTGGGFTPTAPTRQIFTSSSGTYTKPTSPVPLYIKVRCVGGGSGGGGGNNGTLSTAGGNTTFGTSLLTAGGGAGSSNTVIGAGGSASGGNIANIVGGCGGADSPSITGTGVPGHGGVGAASVFGGAGAPGNGGNSYVGQAASANSGAGGGGGGYSSAVVSDDGGCGGAAGGYVEHVITSISSTYSYAVGAGGAGAAGDGGSGKAGGAGATGIIIVEEFYQ